VCGWLGDYLVMLFSPSNVLGSSTTDLKLKLLVVWWEVDAHPVLKVKGSWSSHYKVRCEKKLCPHITISTIDRKLNLHVNTIRYEIRYRVCTRKLTGPASLV